MRRLIVVIGAASVLFTAAPAYAGLSDPYGFAQNYPEDVQSWADAIGITFDQALARMDARQDVDAAVVAINDQPDIYTGVYFTQDAQTYVLHVVSKQGATPTDALKSVGPLTVVHKTAPRSSTDLSKLRTSVEDSGIPFSTIEFNIPDGSLIVTVPTASNASDVTASFGDSVVVDVGPRLKTISCTSRSNCSPYRGGIVVKSGPDSTHYEYCTWGYTARGKTDGVLKMLTAQHCEEGYARGTTTVCTGTSGHAKMVTSAVYTTQ